jgi:phosphoglycerate dehydrogenase-like enzyme
MRILFCGSGFPFALEMLRRRLPPGAGDEVRCWTSGELAAQLDGVDVVVPAMRRIDAAAMDAGRFRLVQQWGAGLEGVDLEAARARGIWVANVPSTGGNAESVAEHAVLLTLAVLRRLPLALANVRDGVLGDPMGRALRGKTVCLCGLGAIASALVDLLRPFGANLIGLTRDPDSPQAARLGLDRCYGYADRRPCLAQADVLILCVRLTEATRHLIGPDELAWLPPGACLVNIARGGLVDYQALRAALASGRLGGAGLDVFWDEPIPPSDPILSLPNVVATPHVAGVTDRSYSEIADAVVANIDRLRRGEPPRNRAV